MKENRSIIEANEGYSFTAENDTFSHLLLCKICSKLMIEPSRLYPCGHTFCKSCIIQHNNNTSEGNQSRQHKCFVPFPECGKYYITLQPDLLAASLIDDLEVKCLSEGCPWKGPLERFKVSHKNLCKLKDGGLSSWLNDFNEGVKSIKKIRYERKKNNCIDIDESDEVEVLEENPNRKRKNELSIFENLNEKNVMSSHEFLKPENEYLFRNSEKDNLVDGHYTTNADVTQKKSFLGLNKNKVGDQRKNKKKGQYEVVNLDNEVSNEEKNNNNLFSSNRKSNSFSINLNIDIHEEVSENESKELNIDLTDTNTNNKNKNEIEGELNAEKVKENFTGMKMINSYKKKSHRIVENPHDMTLTRSHPQIRDEDQYTHL